LIFQTDNLFDDEYLKNLQRESAIKLIEQILNIDELNNILYKRERMIYLKSILEKRTLPISDTEEEIFLEIIRWYYCIINQKTPQWLKTKIKNYYEINPNRLTIYSMRYFQKFKWSIDDVVRDSVLLSGNQITNYQPNEEDIKYWIKLRKKNQELYQGAVFCGQIVGHIGAIAITNYEYELMLKGILSEDNIAIDKVEKYKIKYLYIPTIVILPEYRSPFFLKAFLKSFFKKIYKVKSLKVILANIYTEKGKKLSEKLGFKFVINHRDGGKIYKLDISNKNSFISKLLKN
jgi:hypothetical protein